MHVTETVLNVFAAKVGLLKAVNIIFVAAFALKRFHDRILKININFKKRITLKFLLARCKAETKLAF
jgi:hypothetical protein